LVGSMFQQLNSLIMNPLSKFTLFLLTLMLMSTSWEPRIETHYEPILIKKSDLRASIHMQPVKEFTNTGKIYLYESNIYIVDLYTGIHVIDNSNPQAPVKNGFIYIPGVVDMAIRNNILYADNAIDLVAINLENYPQISVIDRIEDVFPEHTPPDLTWIPRNYTPYHRPVNTVITGWVKKPGY
jgi:hypothetical protein